jgi:hypothetical protein
MTRALLLAAFVACTVACTENSGDTTGLSSLTAPTAPQTVDSFTGTVAVSGRDSHTFTVTAGNQPLLVTLTAAGPPPAIFVGVGVGVPAADGTCTIATGSVFLAQAGMTGQLSGAVAAGSYCVVVFDPGNQTGPIDSAVSVAHA